MQNNVVMGSIFILNVAGNTCQKSNSISHQLDSIEHQCRWTVGILIGVLRAFIPKYLSHTKKRSTKTYTLLMFKMGN